MKTGRGLVFTILLIVLFSGCGKEPETIASIPTNTLPPIPTITNTVTPSITPTETLTPTPTVTHIPTATYTPSPTPFPFPTPKDATLIEISPNGDWGIWYIWFPCGNKLIIQNLKDESFFWELHYQTTIDSIGTTDFVVHPEHWSLDGKYLYFITDVGCIDGGTAFQGVLSFIRLNLATGDIINVLPSGQITAKISPNSQYLAYFKLSRLFIRDLSTGKEKSITIDIPTNTISWGDIHWSPNSTKLVFVVETKNDDFSNHMFTLFFVDTIKMEQKILIENFQETGKGYWIVWEDDEIISLSVYSSKKTTTLSIDTTTGEITEVE